MVDINNMSPRSGRQVKEDNTTVNIAELIEQIANSGVQVTGIGSDGETRIIKTDDNGVLLIALNGCDIEKASAQDSQLATTEKTYTKAEGASRIEVYCESGYIRVRTDGEPCTDKTGEPIAPGFAAAWAADTISVYYVQESVITVVSR